MSDCVISHCWIGRRTPERAALCRLDTITFRKWHKPQWATEFSGCRFANLHLLDLRVT